jgi:hypothetical protein
MEVDQQPSDDSEKPKLTIYDLPNEMLKEVLKFVEKEERKNVFLVSKIFYEIALELDVKDRMVRLTKEHVSYLTQNERMKFINFRFSVL